MARLGSLALVLLATAHATQSLHLRGKIFEDWKKGSIYGRPPIKRSIVGLGGNAILDGGEDQERFLAIRDAPPKLVEARQHGKVVLECSASGSPAPQVRWYKDGRPIFKERKGLGKTPDFGDSIGETKSKVALECLGEEDAGLYECVASNGQSKTSVATELNVVSFQETPVCKRKFGYVDSDNDKPIINQHMESYMQLIGRDALLLCRSAGPHETYWQAPNQVAIDLKGEKYQMTGTGDLIIRKLSFEDMGMYQCLVKNTNGHDSIETFVYPLAVS